MRTRRRGVAFLVARFGSCAIGSLGRAMWLAGLLAIIGFNAGADVPPTLGRAMWLAGLLAIIGFNAGADVPTGADVPRMFRMFPTPERDVPPNTGADVPQHRSGCPGADVADVGHTTRTRCQGHVGPCGMPKPTKLSITVQDGLRLHAGIGTKSDSGNIQELQFTVANGSEPGVSIGASEVMALMRMHEFQTVESQPQVAGLGGVLFNRGGEK